MLFDSGWVLGFFNELFWFVFGGRDYGCYFYMGFFGINRLR